ncbi:MAG: Gfo/Idh/MocA family oxidoreductase [Candidatus Bathyarchaeia archaeon]
MASKPKEEVRIGIIGCGGIASFHIGNLSRVPEAKIIALADVREENALKLQASFPTLSGCEVYGDYKKMLQGSKLDAVEILTPHTLHFQQALDSLKAGLHVLVEKPLVCKVDHAKRLIKEAEGANRVLMVSYQRHYQPTFRYMKRAIESGELGDVQFISALQGQNWLQSTKGTWRQDPELSGGGQLNDSGSHLLDIILWTTGLRATEVHAYIDNLGAPVDINSAIALRLSNGAEASIAVVGNSPIWWEDLTIWGSKGMLLYRNGRLQHVSWGANAIQEPLTFPPGPPSPDANFVNAILGREAPESPALCGLRVIELTEAAWKSAKTGKPVKIKEST